MKLESQSFSNNGMIPSEFTCDGNDVSPPLIISGVPGNAKSLALICDDPDAPVGVWDHWVVFNMPASTEQIPKGTEPKGTAGRNSWGRIGYGGPCPPSGTHRYFFKVYALDSMLNLQEGAAKKDIEKAMQGHILAKAELLELIRESKQTQMKIAVCGQSLPSFGKNVLSKAYGLGQEIAASKHILRFGGCWGYPYEAAKGAFENNGRVTAVSPAKNKKEHAEKYKFPHDNFTEIDYTGLGIPGRNMPLVLDSDAVIIVSGQIGTLNEFTLAFHQKKAIGVLEESGGIAEIIKEIAEICRKVGEEDKIVYGKDPRKLVKGLADLNNQ